MRNLVVAVLFIICAVMVACSDPPAVAARRSIAKTTAMLQVADAGFKTNTKAALEAIASQHRATTLDALAKLGCAASTSQPADAKHECVVVAMEGRTKYLAASRELAAVAAKVDASINAAYSAVLMAVVAVGELDAGIGSIKNLSDAIARAAGLVGTAVEVYGSFKALIAAFK